MTKYEKSLTVWKSIQWLLDRIFIGRQRKEKMLQNVHRTIQRHVDIF